MARKTFPLVLSDQTFLLDFDWPALAEIYKRFGATADLFNPEILGEVVVLGLRRHHPDITLAVVHAGSPPVVEVIRTVDRALKWAYSGVDPDQPALSGNNTNRDISSAAQAEADPAPIPEDAAV